MSSLQSKEFSAFHVLGVLDTCVYVKKSSQGITKLNIFLFLIKVVLFGFLKAKFTLNNLKMTFFLSDISIKCEKTYEICEGCGQKIHDRYYMRVADSNWHEQCLSCSVCHHMLNYKCYVRNSKLYCKEDYFR